eukprot:SAG11_NODE_302_length_11005_cov_12.491748_11_plen_87_part_00
MVIPQLYHGAEVEALRAEYEMLTERCPAERGAVHDKAGRPILGRPENFNFTDPVCLTTPVAGCSRRPGVCAQCVCVWWPRRARTYR